MSAGHAHGCGCATLNLTASLARERRTIWVAALTVVTMGAEVGAGYWTGSMALLADGWHMASHAGALGLTCVAYALARRAHAAERFAFGPHKAMTLAGFTNALLLILAASWMGVEAISRLISPEPVLFAQALPVAVAGLAVNLVSAWLLRPEHADDHHDHNLRGAYLHVLADALTSVLAIGALTLGRLTGHLRMDAVAGLVGAVVILWWALGLIRNSLPELVDLRIGGHLTARVREELERDPGTRVLEVRLWSLGSGRTACHLLVAAPSPRSSSWYRARVRAVTGAEQVLIEVNDDEAEEAGLVVLSSLQRGR